MIVNSPKNIALLNAAVISIISGVVLLILLASFNQIDPALVVIFTIAVFAISFVIINYSLVRFFNEKIKVIYKTIGRTAPNPVNKKKDKNKGDILEIVNQVVLRWSEEKKKEIEDLKAMAVYRPEFLGNVFHEIKTPIFNIQGYVHTLLEGGLKDDSINIKFLEKSVKSINRMIALVEDLEEISKLEVSDLKLKEENFNFYELIKEVVDFMEHKAAEHNTTINISTALTKNTIVRADKKRIRQVLINLIDNSIKYGKLEKGKIKISFYNFQDNYLVEVKDNGIGISEENIKRIFERFYRTDQSRARDKGGSGLGLAIVKHIIEAHRQTISVRSNLGRGTTFSFTLKTA